MLCKACGGQCQAETVLQLRRTVAGTRAEQHRGWYCWSCKISQSAAPIAAAVPAGRSRPQSIRAANWLNFWKYFPSVRPEPRRFWPAAGRFAA